jgi:hypothetical protein
MGQVNRSSIAASRCYNAALCCNRVKEDRGAGLYSLVGEGDAAAVAMAGRRSRIMRLRWMAAAGLIVLAGVRL